MSHLVNIDVPPAEHALTTLDAVKLQLGITDTASDAQLTAMIDRASAYIESYLGRPIFPQTVTETFRESSWKQRDFLALQYPPIITMLSVTEDTIVMVADTDFEIEIATGLLNRTVSWYRRRWGYIVTAQYVGGWATVPPVVEQVCIDLIASAHSSTHRDPAIQLELTEGVGRTAYFDRGWSTFALDADMKIALAPYMAIIP
jgi:hypothetical protein